MRSAAGSLLVVALWASTGRADGGFVGLEVGYLSVDDQTALSPVLRGGWHGRFGQTPARLDVAWGLAKVSAPTSTSAPLAGATSSQVEGEAVLGNPTVVFRRETQAGASTFVLGGGVALPFVQPSAEDRFETMRTLAGAIASRNLWEPWLWVPETMTLLVPMGVRHDAGSVKLNAEANAAVLVPVSDATEGRDTEIALTLEAGAAIPVGPARLGVDLRSYYAATSEADDTTQWTLTPYARVGFHPVRVELRVLLPLDEPRGSFLDDDNVVSYVGSVTVAF